jgi:hypothetical protein
LCNIFYRPFIIEPVFAGDLPEIKDPLGVIVPFIELLLDVLEVIEPSAKETFLSPYLFYTCLMKGSRTREPASPPLCFFMREVLSR